MEMNYCPECGHEISQVAVACPGCGRPLSAPTPVIEPIVVARAPRRSEGFPPWALIPLGLIGAGVLFLLFYTLGRNDETANSNLAVNVSTKRAATRDTDSGRTSETYTTAPPTDTTVTTAPPAGSQTVSVPGSQTAVNLPPTKGRVMIDAKVATRSGTAQAVRNERFYLLDKDLEVILSDADLDPIEGNSLANSFGLSVLYPSQYASFYRDAMNAIKPHIKYAGTTDGSGKAQLGNVDPESYYLFGITKTGGGFALWSSPVSIQAGDNVLNLSPQQITEIDRSSD